MPVPTGVALLLSAPTVFWIRPPVQVGVAEVQTPPLPVTVSPPVAPVVFNTIPFAAPLAEMLWKINPLTPIVVLVTFSAVPVVVVIVLPVPVTTRVPVVVAVDPPPLVVSISSPPPMKLMVVPVLLVRLTAVDVPPFSTLLAPENVYVPAALPSRKMTFALPLECVIVPDRKMLPAPAVRSWMSTARAVPVEVIVPL